MKLSKHISLESHHQCMFYIVTFQSIFLCPVLNSESLRSALGKWWEGSINANY